jgi:hypothetical protein
MKLVKRMSDSQLGRKLSDETKQKMSEVRKGILLGRPRPVGAGRAGVQLEVLDLFTGTKTDYPSFSEAAIALGVTKGSISRYFSRNAQKPYKGRYILIIQDQ